MKAQWHEKCVLNLKLVVYSAEAGFGFQFGTVGEIYTDKNCLEKQHSRLPKFHWKRHFLVEEGKKHVHIVDS